MHDKCSEKPISSHVFQKSAIMEKLSVSSHAYKPYFDVKENKVLVKKQSINEPATFPSFCDEHDKIFKVFESRELLIDETDFVLQIYRCVCRELLQMNALLSANNNLTDKMINKIQENTLKAFTQDISEMSQDNDAKVYLDSLIRKAVDNRFILIIKQMNFEFERQRDKIYRMYCLMMKRITTKQYSFKDLYKDFYIKHISISNKTLPICVSCCVTSINKKSKKLSYNLVLVISFPNGENQEIIFFSLKSDANYALSFSNQRDMIDNDYI